MHACGRTRNAQCSAQSKLPLHPVYGRRRKVVADIHAGTYVLFEAKVNAVYSFIQLSYQGGLIAPR